MGHWNIYVSPSVCSSQWTFDSHEWIKMEEENTNESAIALNPEILGILGNYCFQLPVKKEQVL